MGTIRQLRERLHECQPRQCHEGVFPKIVKRGVDRAEAVQVKMIIDAVHDEDEEDDEDEEEVDRVEDGAGKALAVPNEEEVVEESANNDIKEKRGISSSSRAPVRTTPLARPSSCSDSVGVLSSNNEPSPLVKAVEEQEYD